MSMASRTYRTFNDKEHVDADNDEEDDEDDGFR